MTLMWGLKTRKLDLRLVALSPVLAESVAVERERMVDLVKRRGRFRLGKKGANIEVAACGNAVLADVDTVKYYEECNRLVNSRRSPHSPLFFAELPNIDADPELWLACARALSHEQGPSLLVLTSKEQNLMTVQL